MSRIGSIGSDQLRALRRISELSQAITQNTTRLSTLRRINSAKDDPAGLIRATLLETELTAAEQASKSVTRANAMLSTADAAAGEIVTQLQAARTLALGAASGTLSDADVAANQVQIDTILSSINKLTQTSFAGRRLLDGNAGVRTTGVDSTKITDVDVLSKNSTSDVSVSITLDTQATQGTAIYTGGTLGADATVTGEAGTTTISLSNGDDVTAIAKAFEDVKHLTGISATVDGSDVDFTNVDYGTKTAMSFDVTAGSLSVTSIADGTDAVATINGQVLTGDGATFRYATSNISAVIDIDPTIGTGAINAFNVTGNGLRFSVGSSATNVASITLPNFNTASIGGPTGKLSSISTGGANSLTAGKASEAVKIIDEAIADVTRGQAVIGGFQKSTLDSSSRVLAATIENVSSALSSIRDADLATEAALLSNNQLLRQSAIQAATITNLKNSDILSLLKNTVLRF